MKNIDRKIDKNSPVPKYYQLKEILCHDIKAKKIKPGERLLSEHQLAQAYKVHRLTVRQAITVLVHEGLVYREQGRGTFVEKAKTDKEIDICIVYNSAASYPAYNPFFWFIHSYTLQGIIQGSKRFKCNINLIDSSLKNAFYNNSKGVIAIGGGTKLIKELKDKVRFLVVAYYPYPKTQCNNVITDWEKAGYDGAMHLINLGHKRIAYLDLEEPTSDLKVCQRRLGYKKALEERGIYSEQLIRPCSLKEESIDDAVFSLLDSKPAPTAIFTSNDFKALGAIKAIQKRGLRVPEDIAVVGYDDMPEARSSTPSLTTLHIPRYECGYESVRLLKQLIRGEKKEPQTIVVPSKLIVRESCGTYLKNNQNKRKET